MANTTPLELGHRPSADQMNERVIEFPDNRLLIDLCGEFDRNLAEIEQKLSVQILRRGNQLAIFGEEHGAATEAVEVLQALYERLEAGKSSLSTSDVDRELRMGGSDEDTGTRDGDQLEMFKGGKVEIKTRKKLVEPRTDAQKAYVRSLFENELAFGIGPAGTGKTYLAVAVGVNMFIEGACRPDHPVAPGGRGGREAGLSARRHEGQGRSLHAALV